MTGRSLGGAMTNAGQRSWSVRVHWSEIDNGENGRREELAAALSGHARAVTAAGTTPNGRALPWTAVLDVDAESPLQAATIATDVAQRLAGVVVDGLEVITAAERRASERDPVVPDLLSVAECAELMGVTRQHVDGIINAVGQDFPAPVVAKRNHRLYLRSQVEPWVRQWARAPRRGGSRISDRRTPTQTGWNTHGR